MTWPRGSGMAGSTVHVFAGRVVPVELALGRVELLEGAVERRRTSRPPDVANPMWLRGSGIEALVDPRGGATVQVEHPGVAGVQTCGWMLLPPK